MIGRKGLFGKGTPQYGLEGMTLPTMDQPMPNDISYTPMQMPQATQRPTSFWQGGDKFTLRDGLAGALAAVGDGLSGWAGGQTGAVGGLIKSRMAPQEMAAALAAEQRKRAAELADYEAKKGIDARYASPEKDAFDRALVAGGIDPNSEQGIALYRQRAMTMAQGQPDEPRMVTLPDGRAIFGTMEEIRSVLGGTAPQRPAKPVGGLKPITGGTSGNAGGGFPR